MEPWGATCGKKLMCESAQWLARGFAHASQSRRSLSLMPATYSKTCCFVKEPSPAWQCESGELFKGPMPSASPLLETVQTVTQTMPLSIPEPSPDPVETVRQARNARNSCWIPCQDLFLAPEAIKLCLFLKVRGTHKSMSEIILELL